MNIINAAAFDSSLLKTFLEPWEYSCVTLCSHVRKKKFEKLYVIAEGGPSTPSTSSGTTGTADVAAEGPGILGILYLDKTLLYCIPHPDKIAGLTESLAEFLKDKTISCLSGEPDAGSYILKALSTNGKTPYQINNYNLMTLDTTPFPPPEKLSCDDEIKRCSSPENDTELLLGLQKMYMAKEVAPAGKQISDLEAAAQLKTILKDQLCFALWSDGEIVAKANTNAIGFEYAQLGGVYTHPLFRKNYYAWNLVYTICTRIIKSGRKISLFVKEKNNPANTLYERIGFMPAGKYIIAYF